MGVTTHFFAYDPAAFSEQPTMDRLLAWGHLDEEMEVASDRVHALAPVPSWLEDNKRWYRNLDADSAWDLARPHVDPPLRAQLDAWFSHLFWQMDAAPPACTCGLRPRPVDDQQVVYDAPLLAHILDLEADLDPLDDAFAQAFQGGPPELARYPWMYEADGFRHLVHSWQRTFEEAVKNGSSWSLLRWVWL